MSNTLDELRERITECQRCPRLRNHCQIIAAEKRRQFSHETYWGKPVSGWGDAEAELLVVGLAPAAHGANRTGRMFTGDQSGVWLYRALYKAGFASQAESTSVDDGLKLYNCYVTAVVKCAPPDNKPTREETVACSEYLALELSNLKKVRTYLCLGQFALQGLWRQLKPEIKPFLALPKFKHGDQIRLLDGRQILMSYHPSQQNTFTKKLTEPMFDSIFEKLKELSFSP